ncbi:MAG: nitrogen regulation protein NR(II) [Pseudomonadota bacterium]
MGLAADILDHISSAVIAMDSELSVLAVNVAAENLLQVSSPRIAGAHASTLFAGSREWLGSLYKVMDSNSPMAQRNVPLRLPGGQEIHVDMMLTPIHEAKRDFRLLAELQPVDRLLKISREGHLLDAQATTRAVIRGLAHEIKNPLGGVRGAAQLLARELPDANLTEYTSIIIREADRLRDLVDQMMGPRDTPRIEALNIHEVLEHVCQLVTAEAGDELTISRDYDPSIPELQGDRSQLVQTVLNIARNALQAAEADCHITFRTRTRRQFTIGSRRHRLVTQIDIIDDGPGIPADLLPSIFVPMVTGRASGTGLGLSIAQAIISRHGGLLECSSEPGKTCFTLYLPLEFQYAKVS